MLLIYKIKFYVRQLQAITQTWYFMQEILNNVGMQLKQYFLSITLSDAKAVSIEKHISTIDYIWIFLSRYTLLIFVQMSC